MSVFMFILFVFDLQSQELFGKLAGSAGLDPTGKSLLEHLVSLYGQK